MLFIIKVLKINISFYKLLFKFFSNKLNLKLYNNLDKEVKDFKELRDELGTQHIIKYFYYQEDRDITYI